MHEFGTRLIDGSWCVTAVDLEGAELFDDPEGHRVVIRKFIGPDAERRARELCDKLNAAL
jgi:hypothetical protein